MAEVPNIQIEFVRMAFCEALSYLPWDKQQAEVRQFLLDWLDYNEQTDQEAFILKVLAAFEE